MSYRSATSAQTTLTYRTIRCLVLFFICCCPLTNSIAQSCESFFEASSQSERQLTWAWQRETPGLWRTQTASVILHDDRIWIAQPTFPPSSLLQRLTRDGIVELSVRHPFLINRIDVGAQGAFGCGWVPDASGLLDFTFLDFHVFRLDLNGNLLWSRVFGSPAAEDTAHCIALGDDCLYVGGGIAVDELHESGVRTTDAFLKKLDLDGQEIWTVRFGLPPEVLGNGWDFFTDLALAKDGGVYAVGYLESDAGDPFFLHRYDPSGNRLWAVSYESGDPAKIGGVTTDCQGVYLACMSSSGDAGVRALNHDGEPLWQTTTVSDTSSEALGIHVDSEAVNIVCSVNDRGYVLREYGLDGLERGSTEFGIRYGTIGIDGDVTGLYISGSGVLLDDRCGDSFIAKISLPRIQSRPCGNVLIDVHPKAINVASEGQFVTVYLEVGQSGLAQLLSDVDCASITLQVIEPTESLPLTTEVCSVESRGDGNGNGIPDLTIKFQRSVVHSWFTENGPVVFRLQGRLVDGRHFAGEDRSVRVLGRRR